MLCLETVSLGVFSANVKEDEYLLLETFNECKTNSTPETVTVNGAKVKVSEDGENNKALELVKGGASIIRFPFENAEDKFTAGLSVKAETVINGSICYYIGKTKVTLLNIEENEVKTSEKKSVSGLITGSYNRFVIEFNKKTGRYTLILNQKGVLGDWKMPSNGNITAIGFERKSTMKEKVLFDDVFAKNGEEISKNIPKAGYNPDGTEFSTFTDDMGDMTFFDSNYIAHGYTPQYAQTTINKKTNDIICERFDYKNPNKGNEIIFKKSTSDDAHIDVQIQNFKTYSTDKVYTNFKLSGEFMYDMDAGGKANLFMLRDNESSASQVNFYLTTISGKGDLRLQDGTVLKGAAKNKSWFNLTMYLNLDERTVTTLINGETVSKTPLKANIMKVNMIRFIIGSGEFKGELRMKNVEITGLDKPYEGEEIRTSMFDDDKNMAEYMQDKIALNFYGKTAVSKGERIKIEGDCALDKNVMFINVEDFNRIFKTETSLSGNKLSNGEKTVELEKTVKGESGETLIGVGEAAEKLLGMYYFCDTDGMIIASEQKLYFNLDDEVPYHLREAYSAMRTPLSLLKYVYDYVVFERPGKEELLSGYEKKKAEQNSAHPMLFANSDDFAEMRSRMNTDERFKRIVDNIIHRADQECKKELISYKYDDHLRTLNTGNNLETRMFYIGFAYQITGDKKYGEVAYNNLKQLSNFPDLNYGHPIDSGSYGAGIAIGYDWFYDYYTDEQRAEIEENAKRLHISVLDESFYGRITAKSAGAATTQNQMGAQNKLISNYNTWVNYGNTMMSVAFMDKYPELCSDLLEKAIRSTEYSLKNLYPDGAWVESATYWEIVAKALSYIFGTLDNVYGTDFGLSSFPGVEKTGAQFLSINAPLGRYNYHDANESPTWAPMCMMVFGKYFNQRYLTAARYTYLFNILEGKKTMNLAHPLDAIFYVPDVKESEMSGFSKSNYIKGLESFTVHEDYNDKTGLFFASHAGPVTYYHAHNDVGDFVFDLNGVRWAVSLGTEDYNSSLKDNEKYRWRTEGHNAVTINNSTDFNQLKNTYAPVTEYKEQQNGAYAIYDMSKVYKDVEDYKRGFMIGDGYKTLTVRDEIKLKEGMEDSEIYWFMHTEADIMVIDDHTAILSSNGESLTLSFETNAKDAKLSAMDAVPLETSPVGKGQNANIGIRKIAIRLQGGSDINLTVRLGEMGGNILSVPTSEWGSYEIPAGKTENENFNFKLKAYGVTMKGISRIPVIDENVLPKFEILPEGEGMKAEVSYSNSFDVPNIIRIYNKDRSLCKINVMYYDTQVGVKDIVYDEVEIKDFSVGSEPEDANRGPNMFDGDMTTRWTTYTSGDTVILDLGSSKTIDALAMGFWKSGERIYSGEIFVSNDRDNWKSAGKYKSSLFDEDYQVFKMPRQNARFIKIVGEGNSVNTNTNILELRVLKMKEAYRNVR